MRVLPQVFGLKPALSVVAAVGVPKILGISFLGGGGQEVCLELFLPFKQLRFYFFLIISGTGWGIEEVQSVSIGKDSSTDRAGHHQHQAAVHLSQRICCTDSSA